MTEITSAKETRVCTKKTTHKQWLNNVSHVRPLPEQGPLRANIRRTVNNLNER